MQKFLRIWWRGITSFFIFLFILAEGILSVYGIDIIPIDQELIRWIGLAIVFGLLFWQSTQPQRELHRLKRSLPKIKAEKPYVDTRTVLIRRRYDDNDIPIEYVRSPHMGTVPVRPTIETIGGMTYFPVSSERERAEEYNFVHIPFFNNPDFSSESSYARDVWARITFFDDEMTPKFKNIIGRWAGTTQPNNLPPGQERRDLFEVDFKPNQLARELDIAMKHPAETTGFVFNNDSYDFFEFRNREMELHNDRYYVEVILKGVNLPPEGVKFCFALFIDREDNRFKIRQIS